MPNENLQFTLNGQPINLKNISPTITLLEYLRNSGKVGTKEGCGDGDCGACTVVVIGEGADGKPHYFAMNSCLIPLATIAGRELITVEGVGKEQLHPVQKAMIELGGSQCGYCTPGFIMSLFAAYYDGKVNDETVEGNLCRCTGYLPIRRAAEAVTNATPQDSFSDRLKTVHPKLDPVSYSNNSQQFYRPTQLEEVFNLLQQYPNATLIAGATDLGLEMSHHRQSFPVLISLEAVEALKKITPNQDLVEIGAAVPLSQIETQLNGIFPSLDEMLVWFAARQIRNRATIGGNLATASPIGDLAPVLLALDAEVYLKSIRGERILPIANFFKGYRQPDIQSGEVIVSVRIPKKLTPNATQRLSQSYKIGKRGTDDISIVAAAFTIDLDIHHHIIHARLAYGGVASTPIRATQVEEMLLGRPWSFDTVQEAKQRLKNTFKPITDLRASAEYRQLLIGNLFEKFFVDFPQMGEVTSPLHGLTDM